MGSGDIATSVLRAMGHIQERVCGRGPMGRRWERTKRQLEGAAALMDALSVPYSGPGTGNASCIVFSMDRALQLHALLGSYFEMVRNPAPVTIIYKCSSAEHRAAYQEVFEEYSGHLNHIEEEDDNDGFKAELLNVLARVDSEKVFFLVDDDLFVEPFDLAELLALDSRYVIPSLRMGTNLAHSYTVDQAQCLPQLFTDIELHDGGDSTEASHGKDSGGGILYWQWKAGELDWGYPLSVDGHIFDTAEILALAETCQFSSPNTFEAALQEHTWLVSARRGACYRKSRLVNIPCNRVQEDFSNRHGSVHQDELLALWQAGKRMDYRALYGVVNQSAHQELPITFVPREG